jgi:hypothetical protein
VEDALEALELAPTLDRGALKRAYFAALAKHPPHSDAEGFRRVRAAYEALLAPGGLERAFAAAPPEVESLLAEYRARFDEALARAAETAQAGADDAERLKDFVERLSRLDWRDAVASAGPSASLSRG